MALRTAKTGKNTGSQIWGCTGYPECVEINADDLLTLDWAADPILKESESCL